MISGRAIKGGHGGRGRGRRCRNAPIRAAHLAKIGTDHALSSPAATCGECRHGMSDEMMRRARSCPFASFTVPSYRAPISPSFRTNAA
jgi:hypothetical protein